MARQKSWRRKDLVDFLSKIKIEGASARYREALGKLPLNRQPPRELRVMSVAFRLHLDFLQNLHLLAMFSMTPGKITNHRTSAAFTSLTYMYNDGVAMLFLCLQGFDVQARILLRSYLERLDLLVSSLTHDDIAQEYVRDSSLEASQSFFFRRTSKGKLRKSALAGFSSAVPGLAGYGGWVWNEFRADLDKVVGAAAHSNHAVGMISMFPNLHRGRSSAIGLDGFPNNGSLKTLSDALICALPLAALHNDTPIFEPSDFFAREMPSEIVKAQGIAREGALFGMLFPVADSIMQEHGRPKKV